MASNAPITQPPRDRSRSASRNPLPSRPTTPLRPSSRTSLRNSQQGLSSHNTNPLDALESQFAEFSDGMADLEANFMHLQLMHESLARFSESFAAFLYGLNMNAFCVDFPEGPVRESFARARMNEGVLGGLTRENLGMSGGGMGGGREDVDATFLTTDTSFVEHPPTSSKVSSKYSTPAPASRVGRGPPGRGRGIPRASGVPRGPGRGRGRGGPVR
ncbi:hypothetical protein EJ08DRAFT_698146 [Tothia fuscella]|uniref:DASH complex subunit DAM1 n=1 Tax=Tothia fuscella TaxID=1048955 RepID=A0A9P4TXV8_9PEZI|nr:hypothetical protein EJ08DRAFT_698146 [Tothia fuscella]